MHPRWTHLDHYLPKSILDEVLTTFRDRNRFFREVMTIGEGGPDHMKALCSLHGPAMGDDPVTEDRVHYEARGDRPYASRMLAAPMRLCDSVVVIGGPHKSFSCVLYTVYGGRVVAPREPGDPSIPSELLKESHDFWAVHALATG